MTQSITRWASAAFLLSSIVATSAACSSTSPNPVDELEPTAACPTSQTTCDAVCVDTTSDAKNCGACGAVCAEGEVCSNGACALSCSGGSNKCDSSCVDLKNDAKNCGACNAACAEGEVCNAGACALMCSGGSTKCGSSCIDTNNDPKHCGGCDTACDAGEICNAGACELSCTGGSTKCGSACVDTKSDLANCGACGNACATDEVCSAGTCALGCFGGSTKCGSACVDTANDPANCGACGNACAAGQVCNAGSCELQCVGGTTKCGTACVNTATDPANCGACGNACATGQACLESSCVLATPVTTVTFPSMTSMAGSPSWSGAPLGAGGGGMHFKAGDFVEQTFARTKPVTQLDLDLRMSDATSSFCGAAATLTWAVKVNGTNVGTYSWKQGGTGDKVIVKSFTFAAIAPNDGNIKLRLEATSTVCDGGGAWNWYAGGTATMY